MTDNSDFSYNCDPDLSPTDGVDGVDSYTMLDLDTFSSQTYVKSVFLPTSSITPVRGKGDNSDCSAQSYPTSPLIDSDGNLQCGQRPKEYVATKSGPFNISHLPKDLYISNLLQLTDSSE